ncbi:PREDICTED: NADH dehydrogenase [ubiquinone] 1 subunit C1, mitochondrial, partial [Hipposideros armiger]|uniref:NADH dehydrogenase [ubiquinone] 1 subunit C1, mitochondrial n=1 Tax=Hipposideros armiger TaxID=186990 RepID=A0A8B7T3F7_HIPAR
LEGRIKSDKTHVNTRCFSDKAVSYRFTDSCLLSASARSKFYVREPLHDKPDWLKVGFALGTSAFMWICLIKQHNEDVLEYERRNGLA